MARHPHFIRSPLSRRARVKRRQVLDGYFYEIAYRLRLDRDDLRALHAVMATDEGQGKVLFEVTWKLLPTCLRE